jgi:hypothetical protein
MGKRFFQGVDEDGSVKKELNEPPSAHNTVITVVGVRSRTNQL